MPDKNAITWAVMVNLVSSLITSIANIVIGRFYPDAPKGIFDFLSALIPITIFLLYFARDRVNKMTVILWNFGNTLFGRLLKRFKELKKFEIKIRVFPTNKPPQSKRIQASAVIVLVTTMIIIIGFGVVIRWLFAGNIHVAPEPIYGIYRQIVTTQAG